MKIGLRDDHLLFRQTLKTILNSYGFPAVIDVSTGREMIEFIQKGTIPDICLVDINLRDENGFDVMAKIKSLCKNIKVIIISFHEEQSYKHHALQNGADGYISKSQVSEQLKETLNSL